MFELKVLGLGLRVFMLFGHVLIGYIPERAPANNVTIMVLACSHLYQVLFEVAVVTVMLVAVCVAAVVTSAATGGGDGCGDGGGGASVAAVAAAAAAVASAFFQMRR